MNPKRQKEVLEWNSETNCKAEKLVNAGDRASLYVSQGRMRDVKVTVVFLVCNVSSDMFDVAWLNEPFFSQRFDPFPRVHALLPLDVQQPGSKVQRQRLCYQDLYEEFELAKSDVINVHKVGKWLILRQKSAIIFGRLNF